MDPMDATDTSNATGAPPSMQQAFQVFLQQVAQSNAISQQTLQELQNVLQQDVHASQQKERKETLPQISEFDGTCSKYDGWDIEARNKIKTDGNAMKSEMDQLRYIFVTLRGNARNMCLVFVRAKQEDESGSGIQLLNYLACTYSDPNRQKKALNNVYSIKQKTSKSFAQFLPRFETELANAGALSFDNTIKILLLENPVSQGMQERLVSVFSVSWSTTLSPSCFKPLDPDWTHSKHHGKEEANHFPHRTLMLTKWIRNLPAPLLPSFWPMQIAAPSG
jgi:hypothetical protein